MLFHSSVYARRTPGEYAGLFAILAQPSRHDVMALELFWEDKISLGNAAQTLSHAAGAAHHLSPHRVTTSLVCRDLRGARRGSQVRTGPAKRGLWPHIPSKAFAPRKDSRSIHSVRSSGAVLLESQE